MDITPTFLHLVDPRSPPDPLPRHPPHPRDEFLKEAYRIAAHIHSLLQHLSSTRLPYLSTSRPPVTRTGASSTSSSYLIDSQRDALDAETKASIRATLALISRLEQAEKIRVETEAQVFQRKHNTLRSLFADESIREAEQAAMNMVAAHREGVVWFLKNRLEAASEEQRDRQQIRLQRQMEKGKSLLHLVPPGRVNGMRGGGGSGRVKSAAAVAVEEEDDGSGVGGELSPDQLMVLEKENEGMLKHYEDTLAQVRTAESSLLEISELQTQLATNLTIQNAHIDNLVMDSLSTTENMERGNKELKKAAEKTSIARSAFFSAAAFCTVVIVWDWFI